MGTVAWRLSRTSPRGAPSLPQAFTRVGSQLFFVANDAVHGNEVWVLPLSHDAAPENPANNSPNQPSAF